MTKKQVEQAYKKEIFCDFDIEVTNNRVIVNTSLPLELDIPFKTNNEKQYVYELLVKLLRVFDFSFNLEFNNIDDLASFTS